MRRASLSQSGAYSSLRHLAGLDLIKLSSERVTPGHSKKYRATRKGEELLFLLSIFFDSLQFVARKKNIECYLSNSYCTLEILLKTYRQGAITLTDLVKKERMCKVTACSGLRALADLNLLHMEVRKGFRKTRKEYSLTDKGQFLGKVVHLVDEKMNSLMKLD